MAPSEYHPCSSSRMGAGQDSSADGGGRVDETEGPRVVDASVMPHDATANPNAPTIGIAEKGVEAIRGKDPSPPGRLTSR